LNAKGGSKLIRGEPFERQLRVKPVFVRASEGPCQCGHVEEFVQTENQDEYREFINLFISQVAEKVKVLPPIFVVQNKDSQVHATILDQIAEDTSTADLFLFVMNGRALDVAIEFAQRHKKPLMLATMAPFNAPAAASRSAKVVPMPQRSTLGSAPRILKATRTNWNESSQEAIKTVR
jgi:hypothetical protein